MNAQWRGRAAFADAAEAIGIDTEHVMAYYPDGQFALWSDGETAYCSVVTGVTRKEEA